MTPSPVALTSLKMWLMYMDGNLIGNTLINLGIQFSILWFPVDARMRDIGGGGMTHYSSPGREFHHFVSGGNLKKLETDNVLYIRTL